MDENRERIVREITGISEKIREIRQSMRNVLFLLRNEDYPPEGLEIDKVYRFPGSNMVLSIEENRMWIESVTAEDFEELYDDMSIGGPACINDEGFIEQVKHSSYGSFKTTKYLNEELNKLPLVPKQYLNNK